MKVLNELFDSFFNESVIDELKYVPYVLAADPTGGRHSDSGFVHVSFDANQPENYYNNKLNVYAELILKKIVSEQQHLKKYQPVRYYWNYYNRASNGTFHPDTLEPNHISIVYNLNTCDGGTMIEKEFVKSEQGRAVIFNSSTSHCGVGPTKDPVRFMLNIVLAKEE